MKKFSLVAAIATVVIAGSSATAGTTVLDFNDGSAPSFSGNFKVTSGTDGTAAAPVINGIVDATPYIAIPGTGTSGSAFLNVGALGGGGVLTRLAADWGSIDTYNTITLYHGDTVVQTITGSNYPPANGDQGSALTNRYVTLNFDRAAGIDRVEFSSSQLALELDNLSVTAVPEPAAWTMFILGFVLIGVAKRRRSLTVFA